MNCFNLDAENLQRDSETNPGMVDPTERLEAGPEPGSAPMDSVDETGQEGGVRDEKLLKRVEDARAKLARARGSKRAQAGMGWLARDPSEWVGRKIRNRLSGKVYVIRTVFVNGRVELEKSWMTYLSHVWTIRADFETYS